MVSRFVYTWSNSKCFTQFTILNETALHHLQCTLMSSLTVKVANLFACEIEVTLLCNCLLCFQGLEAHQARSDVDKEKTGDRIRKQVTW